MTSFIQRAHTAARIPIVFGDERSQNLLLRLHHDGPSHALQKGPPKGLLVAGLIVAYRVKTRLTLALNDSHPCIDWLRTTLREMSDEPQEPQAAAKLRRFGAVVDPLRPLGHSSRYAFRILVAINAASAPLTAKELALRMPDAYPGGVRSSLGSLVRDGVLAVDQGGRYVMGVAVPAAFRALVAALAAPLAPRDARVANMLVAASGPRPAGFAPAADGAPRLFGSDVRLRNLMVLAKYGPMHIADMRRFVGTQHSKLEGRENAPFGRGGAVEVWNASDGSAARLDPSFPAFVELRALLLKMESRYPVLPIPITRVAPKPPLPMPWAGDKHALLGSDIPTIILLTIGALGWTFEALCVAMATGYDRVVVKKALKTLELEGILASDRARRPGFNVRVIAIAETFAAHDELKALIERCVEVWPDYAARVYSAIKHLRPRTKEHLRRRKLIAPAPVQDAARSVQRQRCIDEYLALTKKLGYTPTSHNLMQSHSSLYRRIRVCWGTFSEFRKQLGLALPQPGTSIRRNPVLRERCIREYCQLATRLGHQPNSTELNRQDAWLGERIRTQWGGFPDFCEELGLSPARRHRSAKADDSARREACRTEYRALVMKLGRAPSSWELRLHTDGLYKRIKKVWPSFEAFCHDVGLPPPRGRRNVRNS